jgi:large subunit ribosomal protein L29
MRTSELHELDDAALASKLVEAKEELFNLRFQLATGQLDNYARLGEARKDIARIKTVQRQRQLDRAEETA